MKILVTGARGFIGSAFCEFLKEEGHEVVPLSVRVNDFPDVKGDVIFHLAHDHRPEQSYSLIEWYKNLERHFSNRIARQIYISSYSSRSDAVSSYGKTKYALEQYFLEKGHSIVRPGLVLGRGGTFGSMIKLIELLPIIPVPGGHTAHVPYISLPLLCREMTQMPQGQVNLFAPELIGLTKLLRLISKHMGLRRLFFSFPAFLALSGLVLLEKAGLQLPVKSDNLRGLIGNQKQRHFATIKGETIDEALGTLEHGHTH